MLGRSTIQGWPPSGRPMLAPHWRVYLALCLAYGISGLMGAGRLEALAARQDHGQGRVLGLAAAERLSALSGATGLDRPATWIAGLQASSAAGFGQQEGPTQSAQAAEQALAPATSIERLARRRAQRDRRRLAESRHQGEPSIAAPLRRPIYASAPLRVLLIGDSFADPYGYKLERAAIGDARPLDLRVEGEIATALTRPDYFDWSARLDELLAEQPRPELLLVTFGGNEDQNMLVPEVEDVSDSEEAPQAAGREPEPIQAGVETRWTLLQVGSEAWRAEYAERAAAIMDQAGAAGLSVYWIGVPPMRDPAHMQAAQQINRALKQEAEGRAWVRYIPIWERFADAMGGYRKHVPDAAGEAVTARMDDGIHLTWIGSEWVSRALLDQLVADWEMDAGAPDLPTR